MEAQGAYTPICHYEPTSPPAPQHEGAQAYQPVQEYSALLTAATAHSSDHSAAAAYSHDAYSAANDAQVVAMPNVIDQLQAYRETSAAEEPDLAKLEGNLDSMH